MDSSARFTSLAWLLVRIALAMMLIGAAIALFQGSLAPKGTAKPWIGPDSPPLIPAAAYAVALIGAGLIIAAGWQLPLGLVAACAIFLVVTVERLVRNPFTNLTADIGIMMAFALALLAAGPERDRWRLGARGDAPTAVSRDRWSWITLIVRLFIGGIFFSQGFRNLFLGKGVMVFAERLYVTPFRDMMPEPLLWIMGVSNPFVQFGVGLLLIAGLFTRSAATVGALFLLSIIFGHLMEGALTAPTRMRDAGTANFIAMIAVMLLASVGNRWSLDALLFRKKNDTAARVV
jgi:thiosulfate dehydrogenase [quinone] large subunit